MAQRKPPPPPLNKWVVSATELKTLGNEAFTRKPNPDYYSAAQRYTHALRELDEVSVERQGSRGRPNHFNQRPILITYAFHSISPGPTTSPSRWRSGARCCRTARPAASTCDTTSSASMYVSVYACVWIDPGVLFPQLTNRPIPNPSYPHHTGLQRGPGVRLLPHQSALPTGAGL